MTIIKGRSRKTIGSFLSQSRGCFRSKGKSLVASALPVGNDRVGLCTSIWRWGSWGSLETITVASPTDACLSVGKLQVRSPIEEVSNCIDV